MENTGHAMPLTRMLKIWPNLKKITRTALSSPLKQTAELQEQLTSRVKFRYVYLYSEQLLVLKKKGFRFFLSELYFLKNDSTLKYLTDGGMLINLNFQRLFRFPP